MIKFKEHFNKMTEKFSQKYPNDFLIGEVGFHLEDYSQYMKVESIISKFRFELKNNNEISSIEINIEKRPKTSISIFFGNEEQFPNTIFIKTYNEDKKDDKLNLHKIKYQKNKKRKDYNQKIMSILEEDVDLKNNKELKKVMFLIEDCYCEFINQFIEMSKKKEHFKKLIYSND